ncbi:MAG: tetratricopeptide repeat protein [Bacteroidota bacterium]|nr:tetratricopeptide repeat protein [Bacteroidota bacterium]
MMERAQRQGRSAATDTMREHQRSPRQQMIVAWVLPACAVIAALLYAVPLPGQAGGMGFPFDDAYIVLTFARNLVDFGAYSAHASDAVTSGPIAPLQVLLVSVVGLVAGGMRASLLIGIASFAAVVALTFGIGIRLFRTRPWLAAMAGLLMVLSPRMASAAVSGLPTMLLTALLLAAAYSYITRRSLLFFLFAGLAVWTHPAALVFVLAAVLHLLYNHLVVNRDLRPRDMEGRAVSGRRTAIGGVLFLCLVAVYVLVNFLLSGTLFPNPVAAKMAYYDGAGAGYWKEVWLFFTREGWGALVLFATVGLVFAVVDVIRRRPLPIAMSAAVVVGVVLAYGVLYPVLLDHHALLPTLPFFTLLGVWGLDRGVAALARALPLPFMPRLATTLAMLILVAAGVLALIDWPGYRTAHFRSVRYVLVRDAAAGQWIAKNTPRNVRVATHLPGSISYYSGRAIFDITGRLSPELIPHMGDMVALVERLRGSGVHVIAARRDQLEVVNSNAVFSSDPTQSDVMEVFFYAPGRTHLMSQSASALNAEAARLMSARKWAEARAVLQRSFKADPYSSRTSTLYGLTLLQLGDTATARTYLGQALLLHAEYAPAMVPLADILVRNREFDQALRMLEQALDINPSSVQVRASLREAQEAKRKDSLRAAGIHTFTITQ